METWEIALEDFVKRLREKYGDRLIDVVLFGSHARQQASEASDVDIAVILDDFPVLWEELPKLTDAAYEASFASNRPVILSPVPIRRRDWENPRSSFQQTVRREGKSIRV